jgi:hypothetical protein
VNDVAGNFEFLDAQMSDHETNWSMGTFGAIAEFARDEDEAVLLSRADNSIAAVTARGGIRIEVEDGLRLFASETTTRVSWSQRVALCLPRERCAMNARTELTALGPDREALRPQDREATLFDSASVPCSSTRASASPSRT